MGLSIILSKANRNALIFLEGTINASRSLATTSGILPTSETTTASLVAIASIIALGNPSAHEGNTNTSASKNAPSRASPLSQPEKYTIESSLFCFTSSRTSADTLPSPTIFNKNWYFSDSCRHASISSKIPFSRSSQPRNRRRTGRLFATY